MRRGVVAWLAILCLRAVAQEPASCTISGTVVDSSSNKPVVRARVMAEVLGSYSLVKLTDEHGGFCFERLTPAEYHVSVQKAGYPEVRHGVTLAVDESSLVKPLAIRMTRYAALSGTVQDAEGPVPGADVTVWDRVRGNSGWGPEEVDSASADGRGAFHFSELAPGTYYLSVNRTNRDESRYAFPFVDNNGQPPRERQVETFYSASFTFAGATPVEVKAGQQVDNLVLTLKRTRLRRVSGRIENPPLAGFMDYYGETETGSVSSGSIPIARDGSFLQMAIPPARYTLRLYDGQRWIAQKDVDLTSGDAVGVTLEPIETVDVPITFRTEGKGPAYRPRAGGLDCLLSRDGSTVALEVAHDGTYRFAGVQKAIYRLHIQLAGQKLYVKGVAYGGETQTGDKVDLRSERSGGLEVTFSAGVAELQGHVVAPPGSVDGEESDDVTVILVDEAKQAIAEQAGTDQKGRFRMGAVPPGKYKLFAIEGFDDAEWGRGDLAKALAGKSVELELKESEKKQVNVTVITTGEWEAAVKKMGG